MISRERQSIWSGCLNETGNKRRADNVTGLLGGPEFLVYLRAQKEPITKGFFMHVGIDDFERSIAPEELIMVIIS